MCISLKKSLSFHFSPSLLSDETDENLPRRQLAVNQLPMALPLASPSIIVIGRTMTFSTDTLTLKTRLTPPRSSINFYSLLPIV